MRSASTSLLAAFKSPNKLLTLPANSSGFTCEVGAGKHRGRQLAHRTSRFRTYVLHKERCSAWWASCLAGPLHATLY